MNELKEGKTNETKERQKEDLKTTMEKTTENNKHTRKRD